MLVQHTIAAPRIVDRPPERMAVVETVGDPDEVSARAVGSLYGAIAQLGLKSGPLRARWPNASDHPREEWVARWALPVPDHTPELGPGIRLETWYGQPVGEIVHEGAFGDAEVQEIKRLRRFVDDCGYEIAGDAEEEYVTRPGEEPQRTIIRYEIRQSHHHR
jgi:hypothetical protein